MQVGVVGGPTKVERLRRELKLGVDDDQLSHGTCVLPAQIENGREQGILPRVLDQRQSIFAAWRRVWWRRKLRVSSNLTLVVVEQLLRERWRHL